MFLISDGEPISFDSSNNKEESLTETFRSVYPFTTENIAGYMGDLNLKGKKIITVTGSGDHVINAISRGATDITTFDINPLTKYYLDLKLATIKNFSYHNYLYTFLYRGIDLNSKQISKFDMPDDSKNFWLEKLSIFNDSWFALRKSPSIFNVELIDPNLVSQCNLYFDEYIYDEIKKKLNKVNISFIQTDLKELSLKNQYDYMFLSNIFDYADLMYKNNHVKNYCYLIQEFSKYVNQIYFAYLYDYPAGYTKDLETFKSILGEYIIKTFETSLVYGNNDVKDGTLILTRE